MAESVPSVPASVLDDASRRFHSPENISLGCLQVRGMFWPLSCDHFVRDYFELRHHVTRSSSVHEDMRASLGFPRVLRTADLYTMASVWEFKVGADHSQACKATLTSHLERDHPGLWSSPGLLSSWPLVLLSSCPRSP